MADRKVACLCITYNRPKLLCEAIESFNRQTYPAHLRELIILDDAGQYMNVRLDIPNVKLISIPHRFRTLGEKRNACAALASPDVDTYAVWDDDDIYLPRHLEAAMQTIECGAQLVIPEHILVWGPRNIEIKNPGRLFHPCWVFTRQAFVAAGGYPMATDAEDQTLMWRFHAQGINPVNPRGFGITFVYRFYVDPSAVHASAGRTSDIYDKRGREKIVPVTELKPGWPKDWQDFFSKVKPGLV